jgi:hypothetical protein
MQKNWTLQDIQRLRFLFLQGKQIKCIAKEMERSVTALNKAISRFGFRDKRKKQIEPSWDGCIPMVSTPSAFKEKKIFSYPDLNDNKKLAEFEHVIEYLNDLGVSIIIKNGHYYHRHEMLTRAQILLKANQERIRQNLPIFFIPYIAH